MHRNGSPAPDEVTEEKKDSDTQDSTQEAQSQDQVAEEEASSHDSAASEDTSTNINTHKLERDLANREKRIKELEAELAESKKSMASSDERISAIEKQLKDSQEAKEKAEVEAKLTSAGCIDLELGRAALAALEGDVAKLKEAKPYLFQSEPKSVNTTGKPAGSSSGIARNIKEGLGK